MQVHVGLFRDLGRDGGWECDACGVEWGCEDDSFVVYRALVTAYCP